MEAFLILDMNFHQYIEETRKFRNQTVDVQKILELRQKRKNDRLLQNPMGEILELNMQINEERLDQDIASVFKQANQYDYMESNQKNKIKLPIIMRSGATTPISESKDILMNPLANKSFYNQSIDQDEKLNVSLIGQSKALKKQDYDMFKKLQRNQINYSVQDIELSQQDYNLQDEQKDKYEDQSIFDELKTELGLIEQEIGSQLDKQSKLNKVEETLKKLKEFCKNQLQYSYNDVNKQIDKLLQSDEEEVSPLLKFYNEIAANSNFRMPLKSLLHFDQKLFKLHLQKIKKAHEVQMRWIQKQIKVKTKLMVKQDYDKTKEALQKEIKAIMEQHNTMAQKLDNNSKEFQKYRETIKHQENIIAQLQEYIRHEDVVVQLEDQTLIQLDQTNTGHNLVDDKITEFQYKQQTSGQIIFQEEEQLLKEPFQFYSSFIHLVKENKVSIMENELVQYYKAEAFEHKQHVELSQNEIDSCRLVIKQLLDNEQQLQKKLEYKDNHIERLLEQHKKELSRQAKSYQEIIDNLQRENKVLETEISQAKKIFTLETEVLESIKEKLLKEIDRKSNKIEELELVVKIPRLHYKFLEEHGVHEFVKQCMQIIDQERFKQQQEQLDQERIKTRGDIAIQKFLKSTHKNDIAGNVSKIKQLTQSVKVSPRLERQCIKQVQSKDRSISLFGQESRTTVPSPSNISILLKANQDLLKNNSSFMMFDILAEYTDYSGNFQQYTMQLMQRIEPETKKTFELEDLLFHYINEGGLSFLCMSDKQMNKKVVFSFLSDLKKTLQYQYSDREIENAKAYQLQSFTEKIREKMTFYNSNPYISNDKTDELFKELKGLKDGLVENLDKLIERDGKIEVILQKAESLQSYSKVYRQRAKGYRVQQRNKRICYVLLLILIVLIIGFFIAVAACGGFSFSGCR